MSKTVEQELLAIAKIKRKAKEDDQTYFGRLVSSLDEITDDDWNELSQEAQTWFNDAAKKIKANKKIDAFPTAEEDDEEEDEKPAKKAAPAKGKGKAKAEAEDEDEDEDADDEDSDDEEDAEEDADDEEEDEPAPKKKAAAKPAAKAKGKAAKDEDEEDADDEDEKPAKKSAKGKAKAEPEEDEDDEDEKPAKKPAKAAAKPAPKKDAGEQPKGVIVRIKEILTENIDTPVEDLIKKLTKEGYEPSNSSVSTVRSDFRNTCRYLISAKFLKKNFGVPAE